MPELYAGPSLGDNSLHFYRYLLLNHFISNEDVFFRGFNSNVIYFTQGGDVPFQEEFTHCRFQMASDFLKSAFGEYIKKTNDWQSNRLVNVVDCVVAFMGSITQLEKKY